MATAEGRTLDLGSETTLPGAPPPVAVGKAHIRHLQLVVASGDQVGVVISIEDHSVVLGRSVDCNFVCTDLEVSRHHCRLVPLPGGRLEVQDMGSSNGTYINGERLDRGFLGVGDELSLGGGTRLVLSGPDQLADLLAHRQRMEALGRLAGGVAHDFNNLLMVLQAAVDELRHSPHLPEKGPEREILGDATTALERAAELTRRLLGFSRRDVVRREPVDLALVVAECVALARRSLGASISVHNQVKTGLWLVADQTTLQQAILNIILNARDAMPQGGRIFLACEIIEGRQRLGLVPHQRYAELSIRDQGTGMTAEVLSHIFEPFYTTKPRDKGTGLGLSSAYGAIKVHGGDIRAESAPGQGTTFYLNLPLQEVNSPTWDDLRTGQPDVPSTGNILLVDDDNLVRAGLARLLVGLGWQVRAVESVAAAALLLRQGARFDLVVQDLMMPDIRGDQALDEYRKVNPDLPFLVITGCGEPEVLEQLTQRGIPILSKPFDRRRLREAIEAALSPLAIR